MYDKLRETPNIGWVPDKWVVPAGERIQVVGIDQRNGRRTVGYAFPNEHPGTKKRTVEITDKIIYNLLRR